jgi:putative nucleotidyltransferase with HDIG domain
MREVSKVRRNITNFSLLGINLLLLLTNPLTGWVFTYDSRGNYIHETLFVPVAYGFPILYFFIGCLYMLRHTENYRKAQIRAMGISSIVAGSMFLIQMLYFDDMLITLFIASLGVLVIFLSLETPDYVRLLEARAELNEARERETALKVKEKLSNEMMLAFSKAVDAKDHYTNGHSQRVAIYAAEIAKRMGKSKAEQDEIYALGLLHDIGKIGIPVNIINKKGKLTDEEFDIIKTHTVIGWEILQSIKELPKLCTGAKWHHEKYDGTGYPDGLSGKDIPEEARIICVADCYDAMTSQRSYSSPRSQAEVRKEIERCMGTHFDPDIAKYMLDMIDDDLDYRLRE